MCQLLPLQPYRAQVNILTHSILTQLKNLKQTFLIHAYYRDLKPENILLEQNKDFDQIKIIDFGTSLRFDTDKTLDEKLGTPYYIAPEVLNKKYNEKCDIWSCGVILYIIISGMPPFNGSSDQDIMKKVKVGKFSFSDACWSAISDKAKNLITKLLTYDPEQRPSAEEALKHPWITEMSTQQVDSSVAMGALSNLKNFRADQKLKQATFAFIASQLLTKNEKENLAKIFKAIDKNGDGKLSKEEILEGYDKFFGKTMEKEDVLRMFDAVDIDKSGFIDYSEFVVASMNEKQLLTDEKLLSAFKMFDKVRLSIYRCYSNLFKYSKYKTCCCI